MVLELSETESKLNELSPGPRPKTLWGHGRRMGGKFRWAASTTAVFVIMTFGAAFGGGLPAQAAPGDTVVTLTFDDANADQLAAADTMTANGLKGTFFIPSAFVNQAAYLTTANLTALQAAGNEIAGHTVNHLDLTTLPAADATRQVCNGRADLAAMGFTTTSFAYPFAAANAAVEQIVAGCGYNSARGLGDVNPGPGPACGGCVAAESIPPADPYFTKAPDEVTGAWTAADLQKQVTDAETSGGGWVQLTFHRFCDSNCVLDDGMDLNVKSATFTSFATWLKGWTNGSTKTVKTVQEVIGGEAKPIVRG